MADTDLQVVFEAKDEVEAFLYRTMLQEAGIDVFEKPLTDPMLPHIWAIPAHPRGMQLIQLSVNNADVSRAEALIADFQQKADAGEYQIGEETPAEVEEAPAAPGPAGRRSCLGMLVVCLAVVLMLAVSCALLFESDELLGIPLRGEETVEYM